MTHSLSPDRWQRAWSIFEQLLDRPESERRARLDELDDPLIRQTLEGLLRAEARDATFIDQPVMDPPAVNHPRDATRTYEEAPPTDPHPEVIGPYRLLRRVGQGGMGTVYLAVRDDDEFRRRVVVKVVRQGFESASMLRRLRTERQILASLDHPFIGRLYDGGTTPEGLPYFVMEYVEGMPIDAYCDEGRLSIEDRLILFRKVCSAVQYAHQNLVVHRDLKPSNILVTPAGDPKLLDFGIAKLLNPELGAPEIEPTATWHRILTPQYASPEQVRGQTITTASDVYSLGVLLYQLLCGRLPHRFHGRSAREIERILTEQEPPRPSAWATPPRPSAPNVEEGAEDFDDAARKRACRPRDLHRQLHGDLDSITLKALRAVPRQRYGSAERLAADLDRYQLGLAVEARQGTWRYRAAKLLRRHRRAFAAAGAGLGLILSFAAAMGWQARRVAHDRDLARLERDKARGVLDLMLDIISPDDPTLNARERAEMTVAEALERSQEKLDVWLRRQPEVQAEVLHATGSVYLRLGMFDLALERLDKALSLRLALVGDDTPEVASTLDVLGQALREKGDLAAAEERARQAVDILRRTGGERVESLPKALNGLVAVYCVEGRFAEAEPLAREALALSRQNAERDDAPELKHELASSLDGLATVRGARGDTQEAANLYRQSIAVLTSLWGQEHPRLAIPLNNLAVALRHQSAFEQAESAYRRALEIQQRTQGENHPDLASTYNNLGGALAAQGRPDDAAAAYKRALELLLATFGDGVPAVYLVRMRLAATRTARGEASEAEDELRALLTAMEPKLGPEHWLVALGEGLLGEALVAQRRPEEAEPLLLESFEKMLKQSKYRRKTEALARLEALYEAQGRPAALAPFEARLAAPGQG